MSVGFRLRPKACQNLRHWTYMQGCAGKKWTKNKPSKSIKRSDAEACHAEMERLMSENDKAQAAMDRMLGVKEPRINIARPASFDDVKPGRNAVYSRALLEAR